MPQSKSLAESIIQQWGVVSTSLLLLFAVGCQPSISYEMVPATGTVQLDGEPLENAKVVFHSETNPRAFGTTDSQGRFQMNTLKQGEGVAIGDFIVKIVSTQETKNSSGKSISLSPLYSENGVQVVTVAQDAPNDFEFALKSRPGKSDYMSDNPLEEP